MTVRVGGKTPHKLHAHVQDLLSTAELNTSPEGTLKRDTNIVPKEANTSLARPWKYMGEWSNSSSTIRGVIGQLHVPAILPSGFHLTGSWSGFKMGPGGLEKTKICCPWRESKHDSSDFQPISWPLHWLSYSGFRRDNQTDFYARSRRVHITFVMSVRLLSVYPHKSARLQLVLGTFTKTLLWKSYAKHQICLKSNKNIGHFTWRSRYVLTVDSCTKYFAVRQQCKASHLLHFHGTTERVCIVDSYV